MLSRRSFVTAAVTSAVSVAHRSASAQSGPTQGRLLVDSQVHMWPQERPEFKYVAGIKPHLPQPLTVERLLPMMDEAGVDRVIIVPPTWTGERNDYALEVAQRYPKRFAVMGRISLNESHSPERLRTWRQRPGMLGIRLTFVGKEAAPLFDGTTDWLWPTAEKARVPIMFLAPGNLPKFAGIAERHPQLPLIIDHISMSATGSNDEAVAQSIPLAKYPNVSVKMKSGPQYSNEPYPYRDMTPYLRRAFDAFGPDRCHWETDMTQTFDKATYAQRIAHFTRELDFLSETDKNLIMGRSILSRVNWP